MSSKINSIHYPKLTVSPKHIKRFKQGSPWIYANEIIQSNETKQLEPGQIIQLFVEGEKTPLALGYYNRYSLIAVRILTENCGECIDVDFFVDRLQKARDLREQFYHKPYYRLVHAEADFLPGLIIDRFNDIFVLQINTQGMEKLIEPLIEALQTVFKPKSLYFKRDSEARIQEGLQLAEPLVIGQSVDEITVIENDLQFIVTLAEGQKTGWFFDHRENRNFLKKIAKNKTVLDYFCYRGGFSINALSANAKKVVGVDRSESALIDAKKSVALYSDPLNNGKLINSALNSKELDSAALNNYELKDVALNNVKSRINFIKSEVFADMEHRLKNSETFDIVILDPPAFVKVKKDLSAGLRGYEKLIFKGIQLTNKNGFLMIASCSYHAKSEDLHLCLIRALGKAKRKGQIIQKLQAGYDHPIHPMLMESEYLKGFWVALN